MEPNISFLKAERNFSAFVKRKVIHGIHLISYAILGNLTTLSYYCNTVQFAQHYFKLAHFYEFVYKKLYVIAAQQIAIQISLVICDANNRFKYSATNKG